MFPLPNFQNLKATQCYEDDAIWANMSSGVGAQYLPPLSLEIWILIFFLLKTTGFVTVIHVNEANKFRQKPYTV
jgi:hypothetical protein